MARRWVCGFVDRACPSLSRLCPQVCFLVDESNIASSAFLERMNSLLASGEVHLRAVEATCVMCLFRCPEFLMATNERNCCLPLVMPPARVLVLVPCNWTPTTQCCGGLPAECRCVYTCVSDAVFYSATRLQENLHVVFTMNPAGGDFGGRAATSPALFNRCEPMPFAWWGLLDPTRVSHRCVIDWFGDWSQTALAQVWRRNLYLCVKCRQLCCVRRWLRHIQD